jgi:hypothetical protein
MSDLTAKIEAALDICVGELRAIRGLMEGHTARLAAMDAEMSHERINIADRARRHDEATKALAGVIGRVARSLEGLEEEKDGDTRTDPTG